MTPTPQSLDTVTLEAAADVARDVGLAQTRGWGETGPREAHVAASNTTHAIETAIRALAIKPTPAGEGDTALMSRALERLRLLRDAPSTDPMEKSANGLTYIIEDLEHRLAHAPAASPVQGVDETAWLIELKGGVPSYWTCEDWTPDVNRAIRFARAQDAQRVIDDFGWTEAVAVEHMWCEPRSATPQAPSINAFVSVPREPTLEMGEAGMAAMCADEDAHIAEKVHDAWKAMLSASPSAPVVSGEEELRKALLDVTASLAAAISLLERGGKAAKKAAASDKMFDQMLHDYRASLDRARAALKQGGDRG